MKCKERMMNKIYVYVKVNTNFSTLVYFLQNYYCKKNSICYQYRHDMDKMYRRRTLKHKYILLNIYKTGWSGQNVYTSDNNQSRKAKYIREWTKHDCLFQTCNNTTITINILFMVNDLTVVKWCKEKRNILFTRNNK